MTDGTDHTAPALTRRRLARHLGRLAVAGPALAALGAAGCGASDPAPAPDARPTPLEFQFYLPATHPAGGVWRQVLRRYSSTNPGRVSLNEATWEADTPLEKLLTQLAGGTGPDAWYGGYFDLTPLLMQGAAVAVDEAMKGVPEWRRRRDDITPLMRDTLTWKGRLAGMPVDRNFIAVAYSRAHLRRAGLAEPRPDWKWDDLLEMARKAASPPDVWGLDFQHNNGYATLLFWLQFYSATGAQLMSRDAAKVTVLNTEAEQTTRWLYDLIHSHRLAPFPVQPELLRQGEKTVFEQQGPYRLPTLRQLGVDFGVVRNPTAPFGKPTRLTYGSGSGVAILKGQAGGHVPETARAVLAMVETEAQAKLATEGGNMPVTTSGFGAKEVKDFVAKDREYGAWMEETPYATRVQGLPSGQQLYVEMAQPLADYFTQKVGLREALERMQTTGQRLLDEEHRR